MGRRFARSRDTRESKRHDEPAANRHRHGHWPEVRRGYVIIPYKTRQQETGEQLREQLQYALKSPTDQTRFLWMQMSQSPERRRRAQLAILSVTGGVAQGLEVEWPTGTVWLHANRVCSATSATAPGADQVRAGWVDLNAIANSLGHPMRASPRPGGSSNKRPAEVKNAQAALKKATGKTNRLPSRRALTDPSRGCTVFTLLLGMWAA